MREHPELEQYEPKPNREVAFVTAMYREDPMRMDRMLRSVRPWFKYVFVALQDPVEDELKIAAKYADRILEHPVSGFCESSYEELLGLARDWADWVFSMDGDELADPSLLAGLDNLTGSMKVQAFGGARILKRTTFSMPLGQDDIVLPGITEANLRLYRSEYERPAYPHSRIVGPPEDVDPPLIESGALREHRTLREYVLDQIRYSEKYPDAEPVTKELLNKTFAHLAQFISPNWLLYEFEGASYKAFEMVVKDAFAGPR